MVTKLLSSVHNAMASVLMTALVWLIEIFIHYCIDSHYGNKWGPYSALQLVGFSFVVLALLIYDGTFLRFPKLFDYPTDSRLVIETKEELETYITGISTAWTVKSTGVTGVSTETTTGSLEAWNVGEDYEGPALVVTTTEKVVTAAPAGTVVGVTTFYADSVTTSDTDGVVTKTVVRTFTETTEVENPFDPAAAADELWAKYEAVNEL
jgi:hypothetical protein